MESLTGNPTTLTSQSLVSSLAPAVVINLTPAQQARVNETVDKTSVENMQPNELALYGSERQIALSKSLDVLLGQITKGNSPLLFQLFKDLGRAGEKADVSKLEAKIRTALTTTWYQRLLDTLKLDSLTNRLGRISRQISDELTAKTSTLLDLMKGMEVNVQTEIQKLIVDSTKLNMLANEFIVNSEEFAVSVASGRRMQEVARQRLAELQTEAGNDMLKVQNVKNFEQKVQQFESRILVLESAYVKSFANLDAVRLAKGASITTLAETANSVLSEFTDIKTSLVNLSVAYQIQNVQALNQARRELRATLEKHATTVLENISITAAKVQGDNRLEDAQLIISLVKSLHIISTRVEEEHRNNETKFAEARNLLAEAQKALATIPTR